MKYNTDIGAFMFWYSRTCKELKLENLGMIPTDTAKSSNINFQKVITVRSNSIIESKESPCICG